MAYPFLFDEENIFQMQNKNYDLNNNVAFSCYQSSGSEVSSRNRVISVNDSEFGLDKIPIDDILGYSKQTFSSKHDDTYQQFEANKNSTNCQDVEKCKTNCQCGLVITDSDIDQLNSMSIEDLLKLTVDGNISFESKLTYPNLPVEATSSEPIQVSLDSRTYRIDSTSKRKPKKHSSKPLNSVSIPASLVEDEIKAEKEIQKLKNRQNGKRHRDKMRLIKAQMNEEYKMTMEKLNADNQMLQSEIGKKQRLLSILNEYVSYYQRNMYNNC